MDHTILIMFFVEESRIRDAKLNYFKLELIKVNIHVFVWLISDVEIPEIGLIEIEFETCWFYYFPIQRGSM